jgi:hypothetical protein
MVLATWMNAREAHAAPPAEQPIKDALRISGGPCLKEDALAERVAASLNRTTVDARLRIVVTERQDEFEVKRFVDHWTSGERPMSVNPAAPCATRIRLVAEVVATAIETVPPEAFLADTDAPAPAKRPAPPRTPPPRAPETPKGLRGSAALQGMFLLGVLPTPAAGFRLSVDVGLPRPFEVRMAAAAAMSRYRTLKDEIHSAIEGNLWTGRLELCVSSPRARLQVRGCAGAEAGKLDFQWLFKSDAIPRGDVLPWVAMTAGAEGRLRVAGWFGLDLGVEALVPVTRHGMITEGGPVGQKQTGRWDLPHVGAAVTFGPSFTFW